MIDLYYTCLRCGTCCFELNDDVATKRIPLYPEEVDYLIKIAKKRKLKFQVIEDLVFPDLKHKRIMVLTYKILLNNLNKRCPFYYDDLGCSIQENKPFACKAFPLSLKRVDAFHFEITIDPICNFVKTNYELLKSKSIVDLKQIFREEYPKALAFYDHNKELQLLIRKLEYEGRIKIPQEIDVAEYNLYLKKWKRKEIRLNKKKGS
jgi:Fe-S-cluster containining protein